MRSVFEKLWPVTRGYIKVAAIALVTAAAVSLCVGAAVNAILHAQPGEPRIAAAVYWIIIPFPFAWAIALHRRERAFRRYIQNREKLDDQFKGKCEEFLALIEQVKAFEAERRDTTDAHVHMLMETLMRGVTLAIREMREHGRLTGEIELQLMRQEDNKEKQPDSKDAPWLQ